MGETTIRGQRLSWLATGVTCLTLVAHAAIALRSATYVNHVSGVWLALARDVVEGTFYRDLSGPAGYGGTRYFPLFFLGQALFLSAGLAPLAAGFASGLAGAAVLATGMWRLLRAFRLAPSLAAALTALAFAPHFVQQTTFAIRSEPLAAGLGVWGLVFVAGADGSRRRQRLRMLAAAACFTLAFATKVTSLYAPAAACVALWLGGRRREGWRLAAVTACAAALVLAAMQAASGGRAFDSITAVVLAGSTGPGMAAALFTEALPVLLRSSRFLAVTLGLCAAALAADARRTLPSLAGVFMLFTLIATAVVLTSPGTIPTNQLVELHVAAVLFLGAVVARRSPRSPGVAVLVAIL